MATYLFVYGSLRRSPTGRIHPFLRRHCEYAGEAVLQGRLFDLGPYPAVVRSDDPAHRVEGELYRIISSEHALLRRLDTYEGEPYFRDRVTVARHDGAAVAAWVYLFEEAPVAGKYIPTGHYPRR